MKPSPSIMLDDLRGCLVTLPHALVFMRFRVSLTGYHSITQACVIQLVASSCGLTASTPSPLVRHLHFEESITESSLFMPF